MNPIQKFFSMFSSPNEADTDLNWNTVETEEDLENIWQRSEERPQVIYKHSTICSFSNMAKNELAAKSDEIKEKADINYLGVIESRPLSKKVASDLGVRHESPQVIVVKEGKAIWDASHGGVRGKSILEQI